MKRCWHCKQVKEITLFVKDKNSNDGHTSLCKDCKKIKSMEWLERNRDRNKIRCKVRYASKTDKVLESIKKNRERTKENYRLNPWKLMYKSIHDRTKYKNHHYHKKGVKNFLTVEDVKFLYERDNGHLLIKASVDRLDNNKHYTLDNCRVIEHSENKRKKKGA